MGRREEAEKLKQAAQREAKALRDRPPADVIFESLDTDHDGTLSRREFLSGMSHINSLAEGASNASLFSHR